MEKTALQQVKQMLEDDVTPKAILSWIESTGEAAERDAIVDAYWAGINGSMNDHTEAENIPGTGIIKGIKVGGGADLYYSTKYGETDH